MGSSPSSPKGASASSPPPKTEAEALAQGYTQAQVDAFKRYRAVDLQAVRADIAGIMRAPRTWDDGSYAPLFIRFGWHCSGNYDKGSNTGGSNGATMRFGAEAADGENKGLDKARALLEPIFRKHANLSRADLYILASYVALEVTGGPSIPFAYGRTDDADEAAATARFRAGGCPFHGDGNINPSGSRLPPADMGPADNAKAGAPAHVRERKTIDAVRRTFTRLGFDDRETVVLIVLGHQYGRCHPHISGYDHPWYVFGPASYSIYERGLGYLSVYGALDRYVEVTKASGKRQWEMMFRRDCEPFMMLPVDMALWWDQAFFKWIKFYNRDRRQFKRDAAAAFKKLTELGCDGMLVPEESSDVARRFAALQRR